MRVHELNRTWKLYKWYILAPEPTVSFGVLTDRIE